MEDKVGNNNQSENVKKGRQKRKESSGSKTPVSRKKSKHVEEESTDKRLGDIFYDVPCEDLAKNLLGKILVRRLPNGQILKGRIVETESYPGGEDKASATYNGKVTPKTKPLYLKPGTTFVYLTYGMYHCINISSRGDGSGVLLRAVDPMEGIEYMKMQRSRKRKSSNISSMTDGDICNGPSKLCMSFSIEDKTCTAQDLTLWDGLWIEADSESENVKSNDIIASTRIGIDSAGKEWASKPWRFYVYGNKSVSRRDVKLEEEKMKI